MAFVRWVRKVFNMDNDKSLVCPGCGVGISRLYMRHGTISKYGVKASMICRNCSYIWTAKGKDMDIRAAYLQLLNQPRKVYEHQRHNRGPVTGNSSTYQPVFPDHTAAQQRLGGLPHD